MLHCLLTCIVFNEKFAVILIIVLLCRMCLFLFLLLRCYLYHCFSEICLWCALVLFYLCFLWLGLLSFLSLEIWKKFRLHFFKCGSLTNQFPISGTPLTRTLGCLVMLVILCSFFSSFFFFFFFLHFSLCIAVWIILLLCFQVYCYVFNFFFCNIYLTLIPPNVYFHLTHCNFHC